MKGSHFDEAEEQDQVMYEEQSTQFDGDSYKVSHKNERFVLGGSLPTSSKPDGNTALA